MIMAVSNWGLIVPNSLCRKFLTRLEPDSLARRDRNLRPGPGISADAAFARFNDKYPETPKFNAFTLCKGVLHCIEQRIDNLFGLLFRNARLVRHLVDDIKLDHHFLLLSIRPGKKKPEHDVYK